MNKSFFKFQNKNLCLLVAVFPPGYKHGNSNKKSNQNTSTLSVLTQSDSFQSAYIYIDTHPRRTVTADTHTHHHHHHRSQLPPSPIHSKLCSIEHSLIHLRACGYTERNSQAKQIKRTHLTTNFLLVSFLKHGLEFKNGRSRSTSVGRTHTVVVFVLFLIL